MRISLKALLIVLALVLSQAGGDVQADDVDDASGLFIAKGHFFIVGNRDSDHYFRYDLHVLPPPGETRKLDDPNVPVEIRTTGAGDLEDVDYLNDELVFLSEQDASVLSDGRVLIKYENLLQHEGLLKRSNQGLEGLAVWRHRNGNQSEVAISWEGGGRRSPRLFFHTVNHSDLQNGPIQVEVGVVKSVTLETEFLRKLTGFSGSFRIPAIVFIPDGSGLILLVSKRKQKWLMRVDRSGLPIGGIRTLTSLGMDYDDVKLNWEGLAWSNANTELALISDNAKGNDGTTLVFVTELPNGW